jgi:hypothetical protein
MIKVVPWPKTLFSSILPLWALAISAAMERPRPVPVQSEIDPPCKNAQKRGRRYSGVRTDFDENFNQVFLLYLKGAWMKMRGQCYYYRD